MSTAKADVQPAIQSDQSDLQWHPTSAPQASSRYDDVWFVNPTTGWAVNSNGDILATKDGGLSWQRQLHSDDYLRCVSFADESTGWVGTLGQRNRPGRLYHTRDGGQRWEEVPNLPRVRPPFICGLYVVDESVIYASGTNDPAITPPAMIKSTDGGRTWTGWDMTAHATILIDTYWSSPTEGWVVGGKANVPNPTRDDVKPVVLHSQDGGRTWTNTAADVQGLQFGEWGWKIQFLNEKVGFVSLENFNAGAILKTVDGGLTWVRLPINDPQHNANLEGVGFIDEMQGWVGGWGNADFTGGFSSATLDGGENWQDANQIGRFINRFRFFGNPVTLGYSSGRTVYKYSAEQAPLEAEAVVAPTQILETNEPLDASGPVEIVYTVPEGARDLKIDIWNRFGVYVRRLLQEREPRAGRHQVTWGLESDAGERVPSGFYIYRITIDNEAESRVIHLRT